MLRSDHHAHGNFLIYSPTIGPRLGAHPDRIDIRDWFYQPSLAPLPDQLVNIDAVSEILDQGACTGYALAVVINFLLRAQHRAQSQPTSALRDGAALRRVAARRV